MEIVNLVFTVVVIILITLIFWIRKRQNYFKDRNLPFVKGNPILGSFSDSILRKIGFYENVMQIYHKPEVKNKPFFGIFLLQEPALVIVEPELIKRILVKEFSSFTNHYAHSSDNDPIGNNMPFSLKDALWKKMRMKLSPFFTSGKLKNIFYILDQKSNDLVHSIKKSLIDGRVELDPREIAALYTTDVIASTVFGVEANSLENPNGEFRQIGRAVFELDFWRGLGMFFFFYIPKMTKMVNFKFMTESGNKFVIDTVTHVMEERKKSGNKRNDLIDTLIELEKTDPDLPRNVSMGASAAFYVAGFETSATAQSFALYEMAKNQEVQDRVKSEICEMLAKNDGKMTYHGIIHEMPYLDQVINETLRIYPILAVLDRECVNPDGYSLEPFSDFKIPRGMPVYIPIFPMQRDEKYFPDPMKFDPDRFSDKGTVTPFTHMPFGIGPRICIGERLAIFNLKMAIVKLLREFRVEKAESTPEEIMLLKEAAMIQADKPLKLIYVHSPLD